MRIYMASAALLTSVLAACAPASNDVAVPQPSSLLELRSAESHAAAGRFAADPDYPGLAGLCSDPSPPLDLARVTSRAYSIPDAIAPAQVFDNLYFVGNSFSSAWVVETDAGLILIDTLMHEAEVKRDIEGGLVTLGLDPAEIKYVVISHGHGDHTGGAAYLGAKYSPKFVMSKTDWEISQDSERGLQLPGWNDVPQPYLLVDGSTNLTLGSTVLDLVVTPGHTPGTLSSIFSVRDGATTYKAVLWGGTGFNFGPLTGQYRDYANSAEAMRQMVLSEGVDIFLSNHVARDQTDKRIEALRVRAKGAPHPFVTSPVRVSKAFEVFRECALSQLAKLN